MEATMDDGSQSGGDRLNDSSLDDDHLSRNGNIDFGCSYGVSLMNATLNADNVVDGRSDTTDLQDVSIDDGIGGTFCWPIRIRHSTRSYVGASPLDFTSTDVHSTAADDVSDNGSADTDSDSMCTIDRSREDTPCTEIIDEMTSLICSTPLLQTDSMMVPGAEEEK